MFRGMYDKMLGFASHRHAERYLAALSLAESSFFPIPPDVVLLPMALAEPARALRFATITTVCSVIGGALGYAIGFFAMDLVAPWIEAAGYTEELQQATDWFLRYGFWVVLIGGFSPVPYKLFAIAAGALALPLLPFVIASIAGRGSRFFLLWALVRAGGAKAEPWIRRYVERIGWISVGLLGVLYVVFRP